MDIAIDILKRDIVTCVTMCIPPAACFSDGNSVSTLIACEAPTSGVVKLAMPFVAVVASALASILFNALV